MMDENRELAAFGAFVDRRKNGEEFIALGRQWLQSFACDDFGFCEEQEPIQGFILLLETVADFRDELGLASRRWASR